MTSAIGSLILLSFFHLKGFLLLILVNLFKGHVYEFSVIIRVPETLSLKYVRLIFNVLSENSKNFNFIIKFDDFIASIYLTLQ